MPNNMEPNNQVLQQLAAKQLGPEPGAAGAQAPAPSPPEAPKADPTPTVEEKVQEAASPKTEADNMVEDALIEIDYGSKGKRKLSASQIKSMADRYGAMNYKHAQLKPVIALAEEILAQVGDKGDAQGLASHMKAALALAARQSKAGETDSRRPGAGDPPQGQPGQSEAGAVSERWQKWAEDNDVTIPPGMAEMADAFPALQAQMAQQNQLLMAVLQGARGAATEADQARAMQSQQNNVNVRTAIQQNLNAAQQRVGLPDEDASAFQIFMEQRGYTPEDFVDPQFALTVMQDFVNSKSSDEYSRIKGIHERRMASAGSIGSAPAAPSASPQPQGDNTFDRLVNRSLR